jgi:hypothetical protein
MRRGVLAGRWCTHRSPCPPLHWDPSAHYASPHTQLGACVRMHTTAPAVSTLWTLEAKGLRHCGIHQEDHDKGPASRGAGIDRRLRTTRILPHDAQATLLHENGCHSCRAAVMGHPVASPGACVLRVCSKLRRGTHTFSQLCELATSSSAIKLLEKGQMTAITNSKRAKSLTKRAKGHVSQSILS